MDTKVVPHPDGCECDRCEPDSYAGAEMPTEANTRRLEEMNDAYMKLDNILTALVPDIRDRAKVYVAVTAYARARTQYVGGFDLSKEE